MTIAVILMAYGTPRTPAEIEPYYTDIRRGRPPTPEALADLAARYSAIGGISPLAELTEAQQRALQSSLDTLAPGRYVVTVGLKHADPKVEVTASRAALDGAELLIGLVLAPHYSTFSTGQYLQRCVDGVAESGVHVKVIGVESWAVDPAYIAFLERDLRGRLDTLRAQVGRPVHVLFTAHSLPQRIIDGGDSYPAELRSTAEAVAHRLGLSEGLDWSIAWQSAGRTPEPWIGPDILQVIDGIGAAGTCGGVIVCACGFVADHLEVLYDLDIEASRRALAAGLAFDRTASVNDDADVIAALAARVHELGIHASADD